MMEKIGLQDVLIKEFTTRGTREETHDILNHKDSKWSQLQLQIKSMNSEEYW